MEQLFITCLKYSWGSDEMLAGGCAGALQDEVCPERPQTLNLYGLDTN